MSSYQVAFAYATAGFASGRSGIRPRRVGTHERVIHTSDEHRKYVGYKKEKFKILTLTKIVSYDAEIKPSSTFEIKGKTHQAEGTFINVSAETVRLSKLVKAQLG